MKESVEMMLSQLREHLRHLDRLIMAEEVKDKSNPRWYLMCQAYDAVDEAICKLEGALSW